MQQKTRTRHTFRYRGHPEVKTLEDAIGQVLTHVVDTTGHLPSVIIVPKIHFKRTQRLIDQVVRAYAKQGRVVEISIIPVGGCLDGEVWWEDDNDNE